MDWVSRYVPPTESVAVVAHRHIAALAKPLAITVAAGALFGLTPSSFTGMILLAALLYFSWNALEWHFDRLLVTDLRVIRARGLITRRISTMPVTKVTDMTYRRTLPGRLLGYGALVLETAGQNQALSFINYIPDPDHFYRSVAEVVGSTMNSVTLDVAEMERQGVGLVASPASPLYDREKDIRTRRDGGYSEDEDDTDPFLRLDHWSDN